MIVRSGYTHNEGRLLYSGMLAMPWSSIADSETDTLYQYVTVLGIWQKENSYEKRNRFFGFPLRCLVR